MMTSRQLGHMTTFYDFISTFVSPISTSLYLASKDKIIAIWSTILPSVFVKKRIGL